MVPNPRTRHTGLFAPSFPRRLGKRNRPACGVRAMTCRSKRLALELLHARAMGKCDEPHLEALYDASHEAVHCSESSNLVLLIHTCLIWVLHGGLHAFCCCCCQVRAECFCLLASRDLQHATKNRLRSPKAFLLVAPHQLVAADVALFWPAAGSAILTAAVSPSKSLPAPPICASWWLCNERGTAVGVLLTRPRPPTFI